MTETSLRFGHRVLDDWVAVCAERDAACQREDSRECVSTPADDAAAERILESALKVVREEAVQGEALRLQAGQRWRGSLRVAAVISLAALLAAWFFSPRWDGQRTRDEPIPGLMEVLVEPRGSTASAVQSAAFQLHTTLRMALRECRDRGELTGEDRILLLLRIREITDAGPSVDPVGPAMEVAVTGNWQTVERAGDKERGPLTRTEVQTVMDWTLVTVRNYQVMLAKIREVPELSSSRETLEEVVRAAVRRILERLEDG